MTSAELDVELVNPLLAEIEVWQHRMISMPSELQSGSRLQGDDQRTGFLQTSQVVLNSLHAATDHLHAMSMLLSEAGWLHGSAPFTLMRAALECSATAVWLLAPEQSEERLARRLQLARADNYDRRIVVRAIGGTEAPCDEIEQEVQRLRDAAGLTISIKSEGATFGRIVELAGAHLGDAARYLNLWRACSGFAHGRFWATADLTTLEHQGPPVDGVVPVGVVVNPRRFESALGHSVLMTREGWKLYDHQRKHWIGRPH